MACLDPTDRIALPKFLAVSAYEPDQMKESSVYRPGVAGLAEIEGCSRSAIGVSAGQPHRFESVLCELRLSRLSQANLAALTRFSAFRLCRVGLNALNAEDVVQDTLLAVLRGLESPKEGRHPRTADLASDEAFMDYLRGIIGSLVASQRDWCQHRFLHQPLEQDPEACALIELRDPYRDLEWGDLQKQLFIALDKTVPVRLRDLVSNWSQGWQECDRIPVSGRHRGCRAELRKTAAKLLMKLMKPVVGMRASPK